VQEAPADEPVPTYDVRVHDDAVWVKIPS
jgi:hypothetical protein